MPFRIGVDTGGTFVDVVASTPQGDLRLFKVPSDPRDLAGAVLAGLADVADDQGLPLRELLAQTDRIVHGSTVATNALLTRRGARAALLTTDGFRDVLSMRRGMRERPLDSRSAPPPPVIPRRRIHTIVERLDCEGQELVPLDRESVDAAIAELRREDVEGVAVCFLFSFLNPEHEQAVGRWLAERLPEAHISLSSEVLPQVRLYERVS